MISRSQELTITAELSLVYGGSSKVHSCSVVNAHDVPLAADASASGTQNAQDMHRHTLVSLQTAV